MDQEDARDYKEPCPQCSKVNWGISDEGKYYCKCCQTVIEKTKEVDADDIFMQNAKIQTICRGLRKKKRASKSGWEWYICEGFQFILLKQAEALEDLGISPDIKDHMCNLWRRYLQETNQAYCDAPTDQRLRVHYTTSEADADIDQPSQSSVGVASSGTCSEASGDQSDAPGYVDAAATSDAESVASVRSLGSVDGGTYKKRRGRIMSMPMTLAFCYLSILWLRASITLSDLLRLVFYRHIPYYNPQQYFPENTQLYGPDINLFSVENFPLYERILEMSHDLAAFLKLPQFPPITETCYCHPYVLCMKYLMEVNLPDELHYWTCSVAKHAELDEEAVLTFEPTALNKKLCQYDLQAVAIIVVVLKLIFALNDDFEWQLAKLAQKKNQTENDVTIFDFEKWYMTIRPCLDEARRNIMEEKARFIWDSERVLAYSSNSRARLLKRTRIEKNLQSRFSKLAGAAPDAGNRRPSSFLFNWEERNTGKICFRGHSLEGIAQKGQKEFFSLRKKYWLSSVKKCASSMCKHWNLYDETQLPSSYHFILSLFSTVLGVEHKDIHYIVCLLEQKLVSRNTKTTKVKQDGKGKT